jgi:molybdopterin-guanine dinucleotide biosynthesis protein A
MGGEDKAFLRVERRPIVERTLELLGSVFPEVVVVTNAPQKYTSYGVDVVEDVFRGVGPLAGIHAGLRRISHPYAFVVACDMPYLRADAIEFLVRRLRQQEAIIPTWDDDIEPLHALYAKVLHPRIENAVQRGLRGIREFLPEVDVDYVPEAEMRRVRGAEQSFCNVNTPEDAARHAVERPVLAG